MATEKGRVQLKIEQFSQFVKTDDFTYRDSEPILVQSLPWALRVFHLIDGERDRLAFYVLCNKWSRDPEWSCTADLTLRVLSQDGDRPDYADPYLKCTFNEEKPLWGFWPIMIEDLLNPGKGWYNPDKEDTVIVEAEIWAQAPIGLKQVPKSAADQQIREIHQKPMEEAERNSTSVADEEPQIKHAKPPMCNKCWDIEEAEGTVEFDGGNYVLTAKGLDGALVRAMEPLPNWKRGYVYYEFKIVNASQRCCVQLGICQKTTPSSIFYAFESAHAFCATKGDVIGWGAKFSSGMFFFLRNGRLAFLTDLKSKKLRKGVGMTLAVRLCGDGCSVQLGHSEMAKEEEEGCPY